MEVLPHVLQTILLFVFINVDDKAQASDEETLIQPYIVSYGNLTCHHCVQSVHGYNCIVLRDMSRIEREHCRADQRYCMVEKYITNGVLQTFTRGCSKECVSGCQSAGVNYIIEKCYSCCQTHFCNIGSQGRGLFSPTEVAPLVLLSALIGQVIGRM